MRRFGVELSEIVIEMFLGTCDVVVLQSQGTKLWQASEGSSSDALDPVIEMLTWWLLVEMVVMIVMVG